MFYAKSIWLALGCVCVGLLGCGGGGDKRNSAGKSVLLKLDLKEGDHHELVMKTTQIMSVIADGKSQSAGSTLGIELDFDVNAVDPKETHIIEITYARIWMKAAPPDGEDNGIEYDSADPDANADKMAMALLAGKTVTVTFQSDGSVSDVRGFEELAAKAGVSLDSFNEAIKNILLVFPQAPVKLGENWTHEIAREVGPGLQSTADMTYKLHERKDGKSIVKAAGTLSGAFEGSIEGTVHVIEATGWTERADYLMKTTQRLDKTEIVSETSLEIRPKE